MSLFPKPPRRQYRRKARLAWSQPQRSCEALEPRLLMAADVLTYHNDPMRTGEDLSEATLTPANVNPATFGKLGQLPVDGKVYAQPLYKTSVVIPGAGVHNVLYVATEHDSVYAFDADTLRLLWHDSLVNPAAGTTSIPSDDLGASNVGPEVGITSTPVIDPRLNAIYVVDSAKNITGSGPTYFQQIHALDLATGAEKFGGPVTIQGAVRGRGDGSVNGRVFFNPKLELQRSALLELDGVIYVAWASYGDNGLFHGWIMGFNARTLRRTTIFNVTPDASAGSIWMSGGGLAADAHHNIFVATSNGTFDANAHGRDYGDSILRLTTRNGLKVADYYTPPNQSQLAANDQDLGSGGVLLVPDQPGPVPHVILASDKNGAIYSVNRDALGRFAPRPVPNAQVIPGNPPVTFGMPAYFNGTVYYTVNPGPASDPAGNSQVLAAFSLVNGQLVPKGLGTIGYAVPGSTPSVSANGLANGIVWTLDNGGAYQGGPAILRAYDAGDITHELYDSTQAGSRDQAGNAVKFTVPTVANGRVYVGGDGAVTVYGLLPPS